MIWIKRKSSYSNFILYVCCYGAHGKVIRLLGTEVRYNSSWSSLLSSGKLKLIFRPWSIWLTFILPNSLFLKGIWSKLLTWISSLVIGGVKTLSGLSGPDLIICLKDETLAKSALSSPLHREYRDPQMPDTQQVKRREKISYRKTPMWPYTQCYHRSTRFVLVFFYRSMKDSWKTGLLP